RSEVWKRAAQCVAGVALDTWSDLETLDRVCHSRTVDRTQRVQLSARQLFHALVSCRSAHRSLRIVIAKTRVVRITRVSTPSIMIRTTLLAARVVALVAGAPSPGPQARRPPLSPASPGPASPSQASVGPASQSPQAIDLTNAVIVGPASPNLQERTALRALVEEVEKRSIVRLALLGGSEERARAGTTRGHPLIVVGTAANLRSRSREIPGG